MGEQDSILVIDADPDAALLLSDFLEREGYPVVVARTGAEGLRLIRQGAFALVLLDLNLGDVDGTVLMREAGRVETPPEVIVVTGHATLDSAIQAVENRSAGHILKPVDLSRLGAIVARVFARRQLTQDNARLHTELAERLGAEALQNARRFEETQRREREANTLSDGLVLLNQAARALHRTLEVDALDGALKELARAFAASGALVHLLAEDGSLSRSVGHWMSGGQRPGDPGRLGGLGDHVRRTRAPLLLHDVTKHPDFVHPANVVHTIPVALICLNHKHLPAHS
jgi:DNA-binding response OmpR family regulator